MELKNLMEAVYAETRLLDEMLALLERETVELGKVDTAAMADSNLTKEKLISAIGEHSVTLKKAISDCSIMEKLDSGTTLGELAKHLAKKGNGELISCQQKLVATAEKIRQTTMLNQEIADRFTEMAATSLSLVSRLVNQSNVYGASGGYQQRTASAVMINREA